MNTDLNDKTAFVTGAGSGIGREIAVTLAENGADVAVNDVDEDAAEATAAAVEETGSRAVTAVADISDYDAVRHVVDETIDAFGAIDVLVNNAGWDRLEPFLSNEPETWDRLIDVNFRGPIHVTRAVAEHMTDRGGGSIVSIASDAGRVGSMGEAVYSGCKGGIIAMSKTWAREFARDNVRVNVVSPGLTDTPLLEELQETDFGENVIGAITDQIPFGLGEPDDIATAVLFFASDETDYITGQVLSVSGGLSFHD
ncbi:MAG: SDR family NAD(P)-dependent oxidoreductase [Bradymonadaceae bacterium]